METHPTAHTRDFIPQSCMQQQRRIMSQGDKHTVLLLLASAVQLGGLFQWDVKDQKGSRDKCCEKLKCLLPQHLGFECDS